MQFLHRTCALLVCEVNLLKHVHTFITVRHGYLAMDILNGIISLDYLLINGSTHIKKYHKYITNIPQIYHKSTTKCDIVPQKCDIVPQNRVFYYKM